MAAPKKKPVTPENFYDICHVDSPRVHPDGVRIAYVHTTPEREGKTYQNAIWIVDRTGKNNRRFTYGEKSGDFDPVWSPDGKHMAFVSGRSGKPQIYIIPVDGGEARPLTAHRNGAVNPVWSPDSRFLAFVARTREAEREEEDKKPSRTAKILSKREQKRLEEDRDYAEECRIDPRVYTRNIVKQGTAFRDDRTSHIYIQPLDSGSARRLTNGIYDVSSPAWTPDGKTIVASYHKSANPDIDLKTNLVRINVKTGKLTALTDDENGNFKPLVSPDGEWVYYLSFQSQELYKQRMKLRRVPLTGGDVMDLMPDYDYDPNDFQISDNGRRVYFHVCREGRDRIAFVSAGGGKPVEVVTGDRMNGPFHLAGGTLAFRVEAPDIPSDLFCSDLDGGRERRLTRINRKFMSRVALSMPEEVWLERPDGVRVQGWIMLPHGYRKGRKYPWIVQVHGGPHIMWGYTWWHEFQAMCGKGYGVYFSNPRGSDGYGSEFKGAIHLKWGDEDARDILAGADLVVERGLADPDRLYLTGGSFGGFMTAWLVGHDHRFKAAVAQRGVYNFISMYGSSDALTLIEWEYDTLPWKDTELLWHRSPLKYVEAIQTPLMILHSEQDYRVGISQAEELYVALRRLGKDAELVRYPREGHELSRSGEPVHRVDRINRIMGWFQRHEK